MQAASADWDYPLADRVHLTFDRTHDRIVVALDTRGGKRVAAWLTRRVLRRLLDAYTTRLRRTSAAVAHAPAAQRDEVLQMEHASAVAARRDEPAFSAPDSVGGHEALSGPPQFVVTRVHLGNRGRRFVVAFDGVEDATLEHGYGEPSAIGAVLLDRARAHQFLEILRAKGREAEWDLPQPPEWAGRIQRPNTATN